MKSPSGQAAEYAQQQCRIKGEYTGGALQSRIEAHWIAGFTAGAAQERARGEGLASAAQNYRDHEFCECGMENCHQCSLDCITRVGFDEALAEYKRQRGET
jgi:hypothetical protein